MQHIICSFEVLARQRYNVFWEPVHRTKRNKHSFSKRTLPLHKRHGAAESELKEHLGVAQ
jgi:hypothetical protein